MLSELESDSQLSYGLVHDSRGRWLRGIESPEAQGHSDSAVVLVSVYYGTLRECRAVFWHETEHTIWEFRGWILLSRTGIWTECSRQ